MRCRTMGTLALLLACTVLGIGCKNPETPVTTVSTPSGKVAPGGEYLGTWQSIKDKDVRFEIVRNGDNFLVTRTARTINGSQNKTTFTCVYRDGTLQSASGFGRATLTYLKATDRLIVPPVFGRDTEYEHVK